MWDQQPATSSPGPIPRPMPSTPQSEPGPRRPGALFDQLTDPFEDDSAMNISRHSQQVRPVDHTELRPANRPNLIPTQLGTPARSEPVVTDRDGDYSDYFRR